MPPPRGVKIARGAEGIEVDTGAIRFRVREGVDGETVQIAVQVALSLYKLNPGASVMSRIFEYVYHAR